MRLLTAAVLFFSVCACSAGGPLTPEEALSAFTEAYISENIPEMMSLLSAESLERLHFSAEKIREMDENSRTGFAAFYGIRPEAASELNEIKLLKIETVLMKKSSAPFSKSILEEIPVRTESEKNSSEILMSDGFRIKLKREFPYWKIDISGY